MKADVYYTDIKQKQEKENYNKLEVLALNYQQNLSLPHVSYGYVFYKWQLWAYNSFITSGRTGKSFFL